MYQQYKNMEVRNKVCKFVLGKRETEKKNKNVLFLFKKLKLYNWR